MANEDKSRKILEISTDLLFSLGPRKVTLDDIAERVGVTKTALYHYFPSKQAIFSAAVRREAQRFLAVMEHALERAREPEQRLISLLDARFGYLERIRARYAVSLDRLFEFDSDLMEAKFVIAQSEEDMIAQILRQGVAEGVFSVDDPEATAKVLVACLQGIEQRLFFYGRDWPTVLAAFKSAMLDGLRSR